MPEQEGHAYVRQVAEQFRTAMSALAATVRKLRLVDAVTGAAIFGAVYKVTGPVAWVPVPAAAVFLIGLATRRKTVAVASSASVDQVAGAGASDA